MVVTAWAPCGVASCSEAQRFQGLPCSGPEEPLPEHPRLGCRVYHIRGRPGRRQVISQIIDLLVVRRPWSCRQVVACVRPSDACTTAVLSRTCTAEIVSRAAAM